MAGSPAHTKILEQQFDVLDKNHDGKLALSEITNFLVAFGFTANDAKEFLEKYDKNNDKYVSKQEFTEAIKIMKPGKFTEAQLRALFRKADTDNSGTISAKELKALLDKTKTAVKFSDVKAWVDEHDKNKNKGLDYEEFLEFARNKL